MKYFILSIIAFLFFSCKKAETNLPTEESVPVKSVSKSIRKRVFPIKNVAKVELLSYFERDMWDTISYNGKRAFYKELVDNGKFNFDTSFIKEKVKLNQNQIKELYALMVCDTCMPRDVEAACYMPRNMIVFRDGKNRIIGYDEICFECVGFRNSKNLDEFNKFCVWDMYELFRKNGIKYLGDEDQREEEYGFSDSMQRARYPKSRTLK